jgi:hypothetical protein
VVELETTQLVVARVSEWAKLFAFFTAIPLAFLLGGLAIWGVTKFADVDAKLSDAQKRAATLAQTSASLNERYQQLESEAERYESLGQRLDAVAARSDSLGQQLDSLRSDVSQIGERVGFTASKALTPSLQRQLESSLSSFETFLRPLGYKPPESKTEVEVVDELPANTVSQTSQGRIVLTADYASGDPGNLLKSYMDVVLGARHDVSWDSAPSYFAVRLGLECYFPASFLARKLATCNFDERASWPATVKTTAEINQGGRIFGGILWAARSEVPAAEFDRALYQAWVATQPRYRDANFERVLASAALEQLGGSSSRVRPIFEKRGLLR